MPDDRKAMSGRARASRRKQREKPGTRAPTHSADNQSRPRHPDHPAETLNPPGQPIGASDSAGPAQAETADPNFTAASRDRSDTQDAGMPRMDTGDDRSAIPPSAPKSERALRVLDVMTADVAVCNPDTQLYYVARMMEERDCGAIPVVQSTDTMRPVGIVTDRDIIIRAVAKNQDVMTLCAGDVMSVDLLTVHPDMSLDECMGKMEQQQIRRAIVVDHTGRCSGIIAQADIARGRSECDSGELVREISEPNPQSSSRHYH